MQRDQGKLNTATKSAQQGTCGGQIAGLYDLEDTLGRGHFAVVKLARHVFTGEKVAVKVIDKSKLDETSKAHLFQEIRYMKLVQHPNVVRLYEVIDTATKLYLVLELGDGGDLYEYILKYNSGLPEHIAKDYFRQIVKAIAYCHQLHVVHRDLKPENVIFFKKQGVVKLTDFGFSNKFYPGQKLQTSCGSLAYSAPEILLGDSYEAPAVDVWSLGVILYMLVCGRPPFQEANDSETLTMIMDCKYNIPNHVSEECKRLISRMLIKNPEKRASLIDISKSSWLTDRIRKCSDTLLLPLVTTEELPEEDRNLILQKMENGHIATKEETLEHLEKNAYNHITATYYLLAERKLRSKRQEYLYKSKRPEQLTVSQPDKFCPVKPLLLNLPFSPGDYSQRNRKCSIVREDEEGETSCLDQEHLEVPLNRRGSRSEGRLHLTIQDKLAEFGASQMTVKLDEHRCSYNDIHKSLNDIKSNKSNTQDKLQSSTNNSSDTSDDDTEKRKKKIGTLNISTKSYQIRRDSNDDSDSQEQGACSSNGLIVVTTYSVAHDSNRIYSDKHDDKQDPKTNKQSTNESTGTMKQNSYILRRICQTREYRFSFINMSLNIIPSFKKIKSEGLQNPNKSKIKFKRRKRVFNLQKLLSVENIKKHFSHS